MALALRTNDHQKSFMEKLSLIMSDPEFREFYDEYFQSWSDIKSVVMLMNTYALIDNQYQKRYPGQKLPPEQIVESARRLIMNSDYRKLIVDSMENFIDSAEDESFQKAIKKEIEKLPKSIISQKRIKNSRDKKL